MRNGEAESLSGLEVDDQLIRRWLLHGQVGGFGSSENLVDVRCRATRLIRHARSIGHQAARTGKFGEPIERPRARPGAWAPRGDGWRESRRVRIAGAGRVHRACATRRFASVYLVAPDTADTPSDTKRPIEGTNVRGQSLRLLQRSEVAATRHRRPALDVQPLLGHRARWPYDLTWKGEISSRHLDTRARGNGPVSVPVCVVGPEGGVNGAGGPVQHHGRQQFVLGEAPLDFSAAVAPAPELLDDPGRQADGRVGESVGERLRFGSLNPLVAGLLRHPVLQVIEVLSLLVCWALWMFDVSERTNEVEMNCKQTFGMRDGQPNGDLRTNIAALGSEALVAQYGHQRREQVGHGDTIHTRLVRTERKPVARQRRRDDREGVPGIAAEASGIGQQGDQFVKFPDRAWPTMQEKQWKGGWTDAWLMNEVQLDLRQGHRKLPKGI